VLFAVHQTLKHQRRAPNVGATAGRRFNAATWHGSSRALREFGETTMQTTATIDIQTTAAIEIERSTRPRVVIVGGGAG